MKNIVLILLGFLVLSCSEDKKQAENFAVSADANQITLTDLQLKNAGIKAENLSDKELSTKIILSGKVEIPPKGTASVSAPSGGYVRVSRLMEGNFVNKGDVLTVLENPELVQLQQDYLLTKSNLAYSQQDYTRQKALNEENASSEKVTQLAQRDAENQSVTLKALEERLRILGINPANVSAGNIQKNVVVKAPISGYISAVNISLGQYISPTDRLFNIINTNDKYLILNVFEKDLAQIKVGQPLYAYLNQNPEKKYLAKIVLIGENYNADGSVSVHCQFENADKSLVTGSFMNAEIETNAKQTTAISEDAVVTWEGKQYVFEEVKPKTFSMLEVEIGVTENGYTEIKNPTVLANKKVVTKGAYALLMGLKNIEE
ncbi:MAG: efflux RND transporter periplasmic adaptor subunit [Capnocytophaga sp.]|nr:efflux RND transporter periplasmic adaptor subunit [Capnocytophaga sp.]